MRRVFSAAIVLAVALSACEMRAEISVNDDGSGTFGFVMAMDKAMMDSLPGGSGDPFSDMKKEFADDGLPWRVEEFTEGGMSGVRATMPFSDADDLKNKMRESNVGDSSPTSGTFVLARAGSGWRIHAGGGAPSASLGSSGDSPFGDASGMDAMLKMIKMQVRVTLPGRAVSSNASETIERDGRTTFVWKLDPTSASSPIIEARTEAGSSLPMAPVGAGVGLTLIALAAFLLRRRGGGSGTPPVVLEGMLMTPRAAEGAAPDDADEVAPAAAANE